MRKVLLTICLLAALVGSPMAQEATTPTGYIFGGVAIDDKYDSDNREVTTSVGVASRLFGNLWLLAKTNIGEYGSLSTDIAYFIMPGESLRLGLIAGPNVDWVPQDDANPLAYVVGASGFIVGYAPSNIGFWLGAKYKFAFEKDTYYQDGWQTGFWLSFGFGG